MNPDAGIDARAAALRAAFDDVFTREAAPFATDLDPVLAIRLGGQPYALRVSDLTSVLVDRPITALPGGTPHLRGLAGIAGNIVAVYDLAGLLGHQAASAPRWMVTAAGTPVAFTVEQFDGLAHVAPAEIVAPAGGAVFAGSITIDGSTRPLIALRAVIDGLPGGLPPIGLERNHRS